MPVRNSFYPGAKRATPVTTFNAVAVPLARELVRQLGPILGRAA